MRKDLLVLVISVLIFVTLRRCESKTSDPIQRVYVILKENLKRKNQTKGLSSQNENTIGLREEKFNIWKRIQQYLSDQTPKMKNLEQHKCRLSFGSMFGVKASKILCQNKPPKSGSQYDVEIKEKTPKMKEVNILHVDLTRSTNAKVVKTERSDPMTLWLNKNTFVAEKKKETDPMTLWMDKNTFVAEKKKESDPMTLWLDKNAFVAEKKKKSDPMTSLLDKITFLAEKQNTQNKRKLEPGLTMVSPRPSERAFTIEDFSDNIAYDYYDRKDKGSKDTFNVNEFLAKHLPKRKKKVYKKHDSILEILPTLPEFEEKDDEEIEDYDQMDSSEENETNSNIRRSRLRMPIFLPKRYHWDSDELEKMGTLWFNKLHL